MFSFISIGAWRRQKSRNVLVLKTINSFIQEIIRRPFKKSTQRRPTTAIQVSLKQLKKALSLFLGGRQISKESRFQVEGPTMENARRCLVAVLARGTNS